MGERVSAAGVMMRLSSQHDEVTRACRALAASLMNAATDERTEDGLDALKRICAAVMIADELIELLEDVDEQHVLVAARAIRGRMLRESARWLTAALDELDGADQLLLRFLHAYGVPVAGVRVPWSGARRALAEGGPS